MSLKSRIAGFNELSIRFDNNKIDDLLLEHTVDPKLFKKLQVATALYVAKSIEVGECELEGSRIWNTIY